MDGKIMTICALVLSDIHSQTITLVQILETAKKIIKTQFITIIAGDITNFGTIDEMNYLLSTISNYSSQIYFVLGNCDPIYDVEKLQTSFSNIESNPRKFNDITIVGFGSAEPKINNRLLNRLQRNKENVCLITHAPPYGTDADLVTINRHVGSRVVRRTLEMYNNIFLSICGHIHDSPSISYIGKCCIINPGPVTRGNFAIIKINHDYIIDGEIFNIHEV